MIWRLTFSGSHKDEVMSALTVQYMQQLAKEYPIQYSNGKVIVICTGNVLEVKTDDPVIAEKFKKSLKSMRNRMILASLRPAGLKSEMIE